MKTKSYPTYVMSFATICLFASMIFNEDAITGKILNIIENKTPIQNEDNPTSPHISNFPDAMYLDIGDMVKVIYDPKYEYSIDMNGNQIKIDTPFRKVKIEVISGVHKGIIGWVTRNSLSHKKVLIDH